VSFGKKKGKKKRIGVIERGNCLAADALFRSQIAPRKEGRRKGRRTLKKGVIAGPFWQRRGGRGGKGKEKGLPLGNSCSGLAKEKEKKKEFRPGQLVKGVGRF